MKTYRLVHISDLHFAKISFNPLQFLSKRWIGNVNLLLNRRKHYSNQKIVSVEQFIYDNHIDGVLITGDLTTTSSDDEFALARQFIQRLQNRGITTYCLPGNHDHYTKKSYRLKVFYHYFPDTFAKNSQFSLKDDGVTTVNLFDDWWLIGLDTTIATPFYHSGGYFSAQTEASLLRALQTLPETAKVVLANHFPFFDHELTMRRMRRSEVLKHLLQEERRIKFFLHGHTHRHILADLRENHLPVVLDAGSACHKRHPTLNLLELTDSECIVTSMLWDKESSHGWKSLQKKLISW